MHLPFIPFIQPKAKDDDITCITDGKGLTQTIPVTGKPLDMRLNNIKKGTINVMGIFRLSSAFRPAGDQPAAIDKICQNLRAGMRRQLFCTRL